MKEKRRRTCPERRTVKPSDKSVAKARASPVAQSMPYKMARNIDQIEAKEGDGRWNGSPRCRRASSHAIGGIA